MNILLIDADSTIPNIPLMKISQFHKNLGDNVSFVRIGLPYFPNRKKKYYCCPTGFEKIYCSIVFEGNKPFILGEGIIFGGTGVDLDTILPEEIELCDPDYSIYPDNDISYGFITRGCIRNCSFCKVPRKEGRIRKVADIDSIIKHKKVKFLDNNFLAYHGHKDILNELIKRNIRCQFNQGLDIRLINSENSLLLSRLNYMGEFIFAFDKWSYRECIEEKLGFLSWRKDWQLKFFVYIHPDMPLDDTVQRIIWLKSHRCLPYIMRDITCWDSVYRNFTIDIAAYCNQVNFFKTHDFPSFLKKRHKDEKRMFDSIRLWNNSQ